MNNNNNEDQSDRPVYPIGIASELVGVCQATLRNWEKSGLIFPARLGKNRYYSDTDIQRLRHINYLLREKGMNLAGVKNLIETSFCWVIKNCADDVREACSVYREHIRQIERETTNASKNGKEVDAERHDS